MGCCGISNSREDDYHHMIKAARLKRRISENKDIDIRKNYEYISILGNMLLVKRDFIKIKITKSYYMQ